MNDLPHQQGTPLQKRLRAFGYALRGCRVFFLCGCHARYQLIAALVAITLGFSLRISAGEWCMVIFAIALVLVAEAFNTALESLVDLASPEYHPLAGKAKDVAAGAVLIAALGSAVVGVLIFGPRLWSLIH